MANFIQLLPESIANQIAAGEVVQRPASAVKELLENAIDAKSTQIILSVKDGGRTLIQVSDNGSGMSEADTLMCIERHATSKIRSTDDLFAIRTMGFRGEAIASIAAISHLEIKSRTDEDEIGTQLKLKGGKIESQESCAMSTGTVISVKNLFFNVPARRNFLKSDPIELRHIIEEFQRVALINPQVNFKMVNNEEEVFNLIPGTFRQRITAVFGSRYNTRLVPVNESTDVVALSGFIAKPEFARKTRGEQYFFVNNRFIKSPYLHHAVKNAFENLIPDKLFPSYFIQLEIDPGKIDINIHPTKTEVKFEEERNIYAIIRTAVKQALGKYNIAPSLDFEQETSFNVPPLKAGQEIRMPEIKVDKSYNPFNESSSKPTSPSFENHKKEGIPRNWEKLYESHQSVEQEVISSDWKEESVDEKNHPVQVNSKYILSIIKSGFILIDQHRAHLRILIDQFSSEPNNIPAQQLVFPEELELSSKDFALLSEISVELNQLGFEMSSDGKNKFVINAIPYGIKSGAISNLIDEILGNYQDRSGQVESNFQEQLIYSICNKIAIPYGKKLKAEEMLNIIDQLFACSSPNLLPNGKKIISTVSVNEIDEKFEN